MFKTTDAGRSKSKRPKQQNDCTVRSLATCLTIHYDKAYEILRAAGREASRAFDIEKWARKNVVVNRKGEVVYFRLQKMPFTQPKGERYGRPPKASLRYRLDDFLKDNPKGRFIVGTASHVFAVVDGVVHDDLPWHFEENRTVYCWLVPVIAGAPLWQVSMVRRGIKAGGRRYTRRLCLVEGRDYDAALRVASTEAEWMATRGADLTVAPYEAGTSRQ